MIRANDPQRKSWVNVPENSDFSIQNLPFGTFKNTNKTPRVGVAIGAHVLDLKALSDRGFLSGTEFTPQDFDQPFLNTMMKRGKKGVRELRNVISDLLWSENDTLKNDKAAVEDVLILQTEVELLLPVQVGDYTDFYSSIEHATNVGKMFRDPENALLPNWKHIPVGYHGRASSIIPSGQAIHRPHGQQMPKGATEPVFGPSRLVDFELEMGFITFEGKPLGDQITTAEADDYIFGMCLFNDWSARDIQKWEYVPLGPFLAKNFASSMSPWIVTLDALEPFRTAGPVQEPEVFPYLQYEGEKNLDIKLEVFIQAEGQEPHQVCSSNYKYMYWNMNQQLAHHSVNGCNIQAGDLLASGTISGPTEGSFGSMLELAWQGTKPLTMPDGSTRTFIQDQDTVIMSGYAEAEGVRVGFGKVDTKLLPAKTK